MKTSAAGFTLVEFVVAVVFVGVVLGPFLVVASRIQDLNAAVGRQGRIEAWRSFNDQVLATGINPTEAPAMRAGTNAAIPAVVKPTISEAAGAATPGLPKLTALRVMLDAGIAEDRIGASGYEIGTGTTIPARTAPRSPLVPIIMPAPTVTPADGSVIAATSLTPAAAGAPFTTDVRAEAAPGLDVHLCLDRPAASIHARGTTACIVSATHLLDGVSGRAWTEFPGDSSTGDRAASLPDGRTRWFVTTPDHRIQIYEPSLAVPFRYLLGLGSPVLVRGTSLHGPGSVIGFDYVSFLDVQARTTELRVDFPDAVKTVFGTSWPGAAIGFSTHFGVQAGPFSGDLCPFFQPDMLAAWADTTIVSATPVVPAGVSSQTGTWTFQRQRIALDEPVLTNAADTSGFYTPGPLEFSAPELPGTSLRIGRLSFSDGTAVSTGTTLSINIIP